MTISSAQRFATLSLAGLNRIGFGAAPHDAALAARAVLAAYALLADQEPRAQTLRTPMGCGGEQGVEVTPRR